MVTVLGFSDKDYRLALGWLRWVSWLCLKDGGNSAGMPLVLFGTRRIHQRQWDELHRFHYQSDCMFKVEPVVCPDERETGYPGCATHLFFRALEYCEAHHAGQPILWCEADTVALHAGWAQEIAKEHSDCGRPFLGAVSGAMCKHMPGVAVYPSNWRSLSPTLANALNLPDIPHWGKGKSQAWDTAAGPEIVPQMAVSKKIHQIWRPHRVDFRLLASIPLTAALFHQDKTGLLPRIIDSRFS